MKEKSENEYVRRSSKDYSLSFKLEVVREIENGELGIKEAQYKYGIQGNATITTWLRKHGNFDWINKSNVTMPKSQEQKLLELEQKVRLLEKQKKELEKKVETADKKVILFDMMIDIAEEEFKIPIRKKYSPEQLVNSKHKNLIATCELFGVSRQAYYRRIKSEQSSKEVATKTVSLVKQIRMRMPELGTRKLYLLLKTELNELNVGRDRLFSILKANHMQIQVKRQYHVTTNSFHRFKKHKNLTENLKLVRPEQLWVADITYIGIRLCIYL